MTAPPEAGLFVVNDGSVFHGGEAVEHTLSLLEGAVAIDLSDAV